MGKSKRLKREIEEYYAHLAEKAERGELIVSGNRFYGPDAALRTDGGQTEGTPQPDQSGN